MFNASGPVCFFLSYSFDHLAQESWKYRQFLCNEDDVGEAIHKLITKAARHIPSAID